MKLNCDTHLYLARYFTDQNADCNVSCNLNALREISCVSFSSLECRWSLVKTFPLSYNFACCIISFNIPYLNGPLVTFSMLK